MKLQSPDIERAAAGNGNRETGEHRSDVKLEEPMQQDDFQLNAPAAARAEEPRPLKFAYAGGARPLEGYTIKRGIGRGGFGEVYYALSDAGKEVALKLIRRNFDVELRGVKQCLNLKHPNLLAIHDIRHDRADDSWVVMEYVSGDSLEEAIAAHPQGMPAEEACKWMHGISAGVAYLHDHGIVHRDLKPGNVFSDEGLVKIGDYGLSKFISCSRRSGQTESVGTVHYMAPEIANGRYGKEIDVYALGVMLYEMLTGQVPFEGETVGEVLMKHLTGEPDLSRLHSPYREVVARALSKDPAVRFRDAAELAAALPKLSEEAGGYRLPPPLRPLNAPADRQADYVPAEVAEVRTPSRKGPPEEPVWAWVRQAAADLKHSYQSQNTTMKVILIVVGAIVVLSNSAVLVPAALLVGFSYGVYLIFWSLATSSGGSTRSEGVRTPHPAVRDTRPYPAPRQQRQREQTRQRWPAKPVAARVVRSPRETAMDLSGGLLLAAVVCLITAIVLFLLRGAEAAPEQYAWLTLVAITGTWTVMLLGKWFENVPTEAAFRRFFMLVAGMGVGCAAYGIQRALLVDLPHEMADQRGTVSRFASIFFGPDGSPLLAAHVAYFGFLFLFLRWWRLADSARPARISLWTVVCYVFAAFALYLVWPFPQPWGLMAIATMAIAVQLASPWWSPRKRLALAAE